MRSTLKILLTFFLLLLIGGKAFSWGFWAHQRINRLAVFTLPPEMLHLYKRHLEYITLHAVDPDKRRYAVDWEAPRHYIDVDHYGEIPFDNVPRRWNDAVEKFSEDTLLAFGIVPWHIQKDYYRLVRAFEDQNLEKILKVSADLGHYIADANVPLHTTENYNGQFTNQRGIHGLWESRLPELFGITYNYYIGKAKKIRSPLYEAWDIVLESHAALDSVLSFEKALTEEYSSDKKYSFENRGNIISKVYSYDFCDRYHKMLNGQVERRMRSAIIRIGSYWYSAWLEAGQPNLEDLVKQEMKDEKEEDNFDRKIKIKDREKQDVGSIEIIDHNDIRNMCHYDDESVHQHALISAMEMLFKKYSQGKS